MSINGIPLHPLVVHAVVVFAPLAALFALLYVVRGPWRWALRWPMVGCALIAAGSAGLAVLTGSNLRQTRFASATGPLADAIARHSVYGKSLFFSSVGLLLMAVLGAWALGGPTALASGRGARESRAGAVPVGLLLALVAIGVGVLCVLTGDSGARANWVGN